MKSSGSASWSSLSHELKSSAVEIPRDPVESTAEIGDAGEPADSEEKSVLKSSESGLNKEAGEKSAANV